MESEMKPLVIATLLAASLGSTAAFAQTLPMQSPSESQVLQTNNNLMQQEQQTRQNQQTQFDLNQRGMRTQSLRAQVLPNRVIGGGIGRGFGRGR
jgi:hypothetical protein